MSSPTFIEVCAGCGGLSTGFMDAGFKPLLLNEVDKTFSETLRLNHVGANVVQDDMKNLNLTEFKGKVDLLMGGMPCQSFSHAGARKGTEDPRGKLIIEFNRLIQECEPKMFLVENVKGLLTHDKGNTFAKLIDLFGNHGRYRVYHQLLNAKDYQVPQKRERVLLVGVRQDLQGDFVYPEKNPIIKVLRDVLVDVPPSPCMRYSREKAAVLDLVPPGGCWVDLPEDIQHAYMGERSMAAGGGKRGMARRLSMDEPSLTLTTSPCQKQTERCHPLETRPLSVREYARIQTFPDTYTFHGSMAAQYKQIGNAVPVKLATAMAHAITRFLLSTSA